MNFKKIVEEATARKKHPTDWLWRYYRLEGRCQRLSQMAFDMKQSLLCVAYFCSHWYVIDRIG
jgi:hypothetical protein